MIPHMWSTHQTLPAVTVGETILESSGKKGGFASLHYILLCYLNASH